MDEILIDDADRAPSGSWFDCPELPAPHVPAPQVLASQVLASQVLASQVLASQVSAPGHDALTGPLPWVSRYADLITGPLLVVEPPAPAEPVQARARRAEPLSADPVQVEPARTDPVPAEPVWTEPVWTEPVPAAPAPSRAARSRRAAVPRPLVRAAVLAVLLALVSGGATALAMDKTITVTVDGADQVLHTYATDVAGALDAAGLTPAPQDRVEPALPTDVADGDHIIVQRARKLTLVEGGGERAVWTTAASVQEALAGLGMEVSPVQMSAAPNAAIPLAGMSLELRVPRAVTLTDGTGRPRQLTTTASTVAGLLAERGVELGPDDVSVPTGDSSLADGSTVQVVRNGTGEVVESKPVAPPEQIIEDPKLPRGTKVVVEKGKPGERTAIMRVQVQNGKEIRREQVRAGGSTAPQPRVVKLGTNDELAADEDSEAYDAAETKSGKAPKVSNGAVWDKLAKCEATGNWSINSGNGYYGGLQFDAGTWKAYGGTAYSSLPHQASRAEQIAVASKVRNDRGGYGAWPACSSKLGLPR